MVTRKLGDRAIVAGGSLAGMLSARVLSDYFDEVVVFDRDEIPDEAADRRMTPQSRHVHILLKGGEIAINGLFPGFAVEMDDLGAVRIEMSREMHAAGPMGSAPRWESGIVLQSQSRALLEHHVRKRTLSCSNRITLRSQSTVRGLTFDPSAHQITGVEVEDHAGDTTQMSADLVIDASGRGGSGVRWLTALGLQTPRVEEVKVDFAYASCTMKLRDASERDWNGLIGGGMAPDDGSGGLVLPIEGGLHICSVGGRFGNYPPTEEHAFRDFIKNLAVSHIHEGTQDAEIVSPVEKIRYEYSRFRHYEELTNLPYGFLPVGDALCSVNPTYGQGMSSTALQAKALAETLAAMPANDGIPLIPAAYFPRAIEIARVIWRQANFNDFAFPETEGDRSEFSDEERAYQMALQVLAFGDAELRLKLAKVGQYMEKPGILETAEYRQKAAEQLARMKAEPDTGKSARQ